MSKNFKLYILKIVSFFLVFTSDVQAFAQNMDDYLSVAPPEAWVEIQTISQDEFERSKDQKLSYKLLSYQTHVSESDRRHYRRIVIDLQNASAVEDNGTITVNFDPSYKKVKFHHIRVSNSNGTRNASVRGILRETGKLIPRQSNTCTSGLQ